MKRSPLQVSRVVFCGKTQGLWMGAPAGSLGHSVTVQLIQI